ncbi:MAG: hypothetical protein QOE58_594 [Actinomycetota bacterium]|nr:hypothetical protein [Actinomycetota bacterium]
MANLSLRQLSALTKVSNPYLSQVERGLHEPSVRVLRSIGEALNLSAETLFEHAGLLSPTGGPGRKEGTGHTDSRGGAGNSGGARNSGGAGDSGGTDEGATERAILADRRLTDAQRRAVLVVYRSYVSGDTSTTTDPAHQ